jgi:ribose 1,5-bisphosphokinase
MTDKAGTGGFVLVVGPSGAGKDTLIDRAKTALSDNARIVFPRRLVTRPVSAFEDHDTLDEAAFEAGVQAGEYALCWRAHGLGYAIPGETIARARSGAVVVVNISRKLVEEARSRLPGVAVVEVTASFQTLARRLAARSRGEDGDLANRLARSTEIAPVRADLVIRNEATPQAAADELISFILSRIDQGNFGGAAKN